MNTPNSLHSRPLENPPNAPQKRSVRKQRDLSKVRRRLNFADSDEEVQCVREKFRQWTVEDVREVEDKQLLEQLQVWYTPNSQPRNIYEWDYVESIKEAVDDRMKELS